MKEDKGKNPEKALALFDFDCTVTKRDSFLDFLLFSVKITRLLGGFLLLVPVITGYLLKIISNEKAKEKVLAFYFKGMSEKEFNTIGDRYSAERIPANTRVDALQRIEWHKQQGHQVVIISASIESWLKWWCEKQGVYLICTQMEVADGHLTGRFNGKNCYGLEKARRLKEEFNLDEYYIYAYGDSRGDHEMLTLADEKFYRIFKG